MQEIVTVYVMRNIPRVCYMYSAGTWLRSYFWQGLHGLLKRLSA